MVQPALKPLEMPEIPRPLSLAERIAAELPAENLAGHTVSSMAERFAPEGLRATRDPRPLGGVIPPLKDRGARRFTWPSPGVFAVLTLVALAPAAILAGLLWFGALRGPDSGIDFAALPATTSQQANIAAAPVLGAATPAPEIVLTVPDRIEAKPGEQVAFAIAIDAAGALPGRSVIAIRDLPQGAAFSQGRPYGVNEWSLGPDEIDGLTLRVPEDASGGTSLRVELVAADGAVLARAGTDLDIAPDPAAGLVVRAGEADRVEDLIDHGNKMIAVGYLAGARAYFERAAEAGSGEAALAVGATYNPEVIAALGTQGIKPDPEAAAAWYDRAGALGITDREAKLAVLKQQWALAPAAEMEEVAAVPEEAAPAPVETPNAAAQPQPSPGPLGRLVAAAADLAGKNEWVEVTSAVNLRTGAGDEKILKVLQAGTKLRVKAREGNWVQVANPASSEEGWIYTRFLKETAAP
ncbi:MAG: SH3 domain-containing protein [Methyloceanibacter sp.]|uniref:SH3 domain-containing protein n=1 Tax=Methyloceanibacter sp. TaxID=1965321 RepID=UPI003D6D89A8